MHTPRTQGLLLREALVPHIEELELRNFGTPLGIHWSWTGTGHSWEFIGVRCLTARTKAHWVRGAAYILGPGCHTGRSFSQSPGTSELPWDLKFRTVGTPVLWSSLIALREFCLARCVSFSSLLSYSPRPPPTSSSSAAPRSTILPATTTSGSM